MQNGNKLATKFRTDDPALEYKVIDKFFSHRGDTCYKVQCKAEGKTFLLRCSDRDPSKFEKERIAEESALLDLIDSQHIMKVHTIFENKDRLYVLFDHMDGGSLADVIMNFNKQYSEDFMRYSLFKIASGLRDMH